MRTPGGGATKLPVGPRVSLCGVNAAGATGSVEERSRVKWSADGDTPSIWLSDHKQRSLVPEDDGNMFPTEQSWKHEECNLKG